MRQSGPAHTDALSPLLKQATGVVAERGEGCYLYTHSGERYLDFTSGIGVTSTGHCHPKVVQAAQDQTGRLIHGQYTTVLHEPILKLSQRGTIAQSMLLARRVMGKVNSVVPLHSDEVERAAFVVLKSPDIPSILVETAFISNRHEEHQLGSRGFRHKLAAAIARGVEHYVDRFAPPGTLIAARRNALYVLKQG